MRMRERMFLGLTLELGRSPSLEDRKRPLRYRFGAVFSKGQKPCLWIGLPPLKYTLRMIEFADGVDRLSYANGQCYDWSGRPILGGR